jgi:two-component system OmpR family response regulator
MLHPVDNQCCASVLVVDDEPNILALLCASLRLSGFEVHAADSGARALSTVAHAVPDIVVLDVMLPDCDGFTLARQCAPPTSSFRCCS